MAGREVLLVQPLTYMNRSGVALVGVYRESSFDPDEMLVCYDDLDLPLGRLRIRPSGSAGGHKGMRSIIDRLGTREFPRLRVGIAPLSGGVRDASEYVLRPFRPSERDEIDLAEERAGDAIECVVTEGVVAAMNRFNSEAAP